LHECAEIGDAFYNTAIISSRLGLFREAFHHLDCGSELLQIAPRHGDFTVVEYAYFDPPRFLDALDNLPARADEITDLVGADAEGLDAGSKCAHFGSAL